jgi:hypothetical protein
VGDDGDVLHVETKLTVKISFVKDIDKPIKFWTRTKFMSGTDQKDGGDPATQWRTHDAGHGGPKTMEMLICMKI